MRLDDNARVAISWDAELTFDPTGSVVVLLVDGVSRAMTWQGTPVKGADESGSDVWTQTARTTLRFCGSTVTPSTGDAPALTVGRHEGEPVVTTSDGQTVPCYPTVPIDVH